MKVVRAVCVQDFIALDASGGSCHIEKGEMYDISEEGSSPAFMAKNLPPEVGMVTVFTKYWIKAPITIFARLGHADKGGRDWSAQDMVNRG